MKKIATLKFPTLKSLLLYRQEMKPNNYEIRPREKTLLQQVSDEMLGIAVNKYHASVELSDGQA